MAPLIDGKAYLESLSKDLSAMSDADRFYFAGWRVTPGLKLLGPGSSGPSFVQEVLEAIGRGVNVRAMHWYPPGSALGPIPGLKHPKGNIEFIRAINDLGTHNGAGILDARLRNGVPSSHHQKLVLFDSKVGSRAYLGGIDICSVRWDTPDHNRPRGRVGGKHDAWHDIQCMVQGPAVAQLWDCFAARWNDSNRPHGTSLAPGGDVPPTISPAERPAQDDAPGTHHVQVLQTLAGGSVYPFAPGGEQTIRLAYEKAIGLAEGYIYIEDQYFWPCSLDDSLRDAAARGVKIVLVLAHKGLGPWHNWLRQQALERVRAISPENVFVYHLQRPDFGSDIYVHSKLMIIDDRYVAMGSANHNSRSLTTDSELQVAVVDQEAFSSPVGGVPMEVGQFAKNLRLKLWQEHLGLKVPAEIDDPIDPISGRPAGWPACDDPTGDGDRCEITRHHAVCHHVRSPRWAYPKWIPNRLMNPETR